MSKDNFAIKYGKMFDVSYVCKNKTLYKLIFSTNFEEKFPRYENEGL